MLPKEYRLIKEKDFKRIHNLGQSFFSAHFRLKSLANKLEISRFAVVVSTKVSKKATSRNRLKRRLREIIRLNKDKIKTGFDILVFTNNKALALDYQQLEEDLLKILAKAKLLK